MHDTTRTYVTTRRHTTTTTHITITTTACACVHKSPWQGPSVCYSEEVDPHLPQGKKLQLQKKPLLRKKSCRGEKTHTIGFRRMCTTQHVHTSQLDNAKKEQLLLVGTPAHKPKRLLTSKRFSTASFMYPSLAVSDFQRPCYLNSLSETPALAAVVAPPALRLCIPNSSGSHPNWPIFANNNSLRRV